VILAVQLVAEIEILPGLRRLTGAVTAVNTLY